MFAQLAWKSVQISSDRLAIFVDRREGSKTPIKNINMKSKILYGIFVFILLLSLEPRFKYLAPHLFHQNNVWQNIADIICAYVCIYISWLSAKSWERNRLVFTTVYKSYTRNLYQQNIEDLQNKEGNSIEAFD